MNWRSRLKESDKRLNHKILSTCRSGVEGITKTETSARSPEKIFLKPFVFNSTHGPDLRIPANCHPKYKWWAGGQSIAETLLEINAPKTLWLNHVDPTLNKRGWNLMAKHFGQG